jgi:hypothetical protein
VCAFAGLVRLKCALDRVCAIELAGQRGVQVDDNICTQCAEIPSASQEAHAQ